MFSLSEIRAFLGEYFKTKPVLRAWIFGSFSRGEEHEGSDVDILVDIDRNAHVGLEFFNMFEDLRTKLGRNVDLVTTKSLADFAKANVDNDKILVYERGM